jgi:apolipoprotein D and lipocalin family protein
LPNRRPRIAASAASLLQSVVPAILLLPFFFAASRVSAQSATPAAQVDPNRLIGTYFVIARAPIKREKHCVSDEMILYDLNDKRNTFQIVTTCKLKGNTSDAWNNSGKFSKTGNGQLRLNWIWPFTTKYWILALAPDYSWALVGTPNHKSVWILARAITLPPDVLAAIQAKASTQGFNTAKLVQITQNPRPPVAPATTTPAMKTPTPPEPADISNKEP